MRGPRRRDLTETPPGATTPRILGMVEGNPATALSGLAHHLLGALGRQLTVIGCLDYQPHGVRKLALAGATFRPRRDEWRPRFHTSLLAHQVLSRTLARRLRGLDGGFELALQLFGWVRGQPHPYAVYIDQTRLMAERGWPQWMPLRPRERSRVLELERQMYAAASQLLTMGVVARDSLIADYGIPTERITVVGGGPMFDALPAASGPAIEPTVTFVGREFERKGGDCLLEAFAMVRRELPRAELHIAGVELDISQPGVVCHGRIRRRERISEMYRRSRVFCMPSRYEPWGFVFPEAMAHGIPCVGTNVQSIPDILDHGRAGLLVPPGDAQALAAALLRLLSDDELARRLGHVGRQRVESHLLWEHVAARATPALVAAARDRGP